MAINGDMFKGMAKRLPIVVRDELSKSDALLQSYITAHMHGTDKLAKGQRNTTDELYSKTGALLRAIAGGKGHIFDVNVTGSNVLLTVGVKLSVIPYARIHELGGTIKHPGGTPYFVGSGGKAVFMKKDGSYPNGTKFTKAHDIKIKPRPYIVPALKEFIKEEMQDILNNIVRRVLNE